MQKFAGELPLMRAAPWIVVDWLKAGAVTQAMGLPSAM
jgi:hypothetical protein